MVVFDRLLFILLTQGVTDLKGSTEEISIIETEQGSNLMKIVFSKINIPTNGSSKLETVYTAD
jgi:hypothetical protein